MAADGGGGTLDPDTRRTLAAGRQSIGEVVVTARSYGRRLFIVFVIGLLGTIYAMRAWIWPELKEDLLAQGADVVVITPFDVILLQAKLGIVVGLLMLVPFLVYYAREPLKERGRYPEEGIASWKFAAVAIASFLLFIGGAVYAYNLFFPVMFDFLAQNAISAGLAPTYSIVDWTQFILVLGLSFGLAAQLPLVMTALAYAEIVPYETFRDKWKYAILGMFGFGALFSPPDPFTQMMWAGPLVVLYAISLYLARLAVALRRGKDALDLGRDVRANAPKLAAGFVVAAGVAWWFLTSGYVLVNRALPRVPADYRPGPIDPAAALPLGPEVGTLLVAGLAGLLVAVLVLAYVAWPDLEPRAGPMGRPEAIDVGTLDAEGVRAAPPEAFAELSEDEVLAHARAAMEADQPEKAQAIFDRYDEAEEMAAAEAEAEAGAADGDAAGEAVSGEGDATAGDGEAAAAAGGATATRQADEAAEGGFLTRRAAGVMDAFTEDETTEEDIGGYAYDIAFVLDSLTSKGFRLFAVFGIVMVSVFGFLYSGGIGAIRDDFLRRLPEVVRPEEVDIITLHPVEALVFEVKIATLLGVVATLPMILYYAWPALEARGFASGNRNVFFGWAGAIFGGLILGSALGYLYVAPAVISYFVWDAVQADMIIAYRVSNFFWLVFFTTVGIGLLADVPVTMLLFHRGGIVSYTTMRDRWRVVTLGVMAFAAVFTPASVLSMVLVAFPVMFAYFVGLGILWVYTLGGRRAPRGAAESG